MNKFIDKDKEEFIKFLNFIATNATFSLKTQDALNYVQMLQYMQKNILTKIEQNIFEIKKVVESNEGEVS